MPIVIVFNKQDLPNKFNSISFLQEIEYRKHGKIDTRYSIALNGEGVLSSFEDILRLIFLDNPLGPSV
ncbi:MAG: hypothetical protein ACTSQJ_02610 [Promethearchaeota archaeon]